MWRWIVTLAVSLLILCDVALTDTTTCTFENGTMCDWKIKHGWKLTQAAALSDSAIDRTYLSSNGHVLAFDYLSYSASYASPFIYYPSSSCFISFYYYLSLEIAASFGLSLVSSNGNRMMAWNVSWPGYLNRTDCNSTWSWNVTSIYVPQFVYPFQFVFEAQSNVSNMTTAEGCQVVAIDEIKVTGCDPVAPRISSLTSKIEVQKGDQFNLSVMVTGVPYPSISWFRNDAPLVSDGRVTIHTGGKVVEIEHGELADTGVFLANASTSEEWVSQAVEVTVYVSPFIYDSPGNQTVVIQGSNLTLDCPAGGHPSLNISWFYGEDLLTLSTQTGAQLHLYNVQFIQQGNYSCVAANQFGQAVWWNLVYVQVPPAIVNISFGLQVLVPYDGVAVLNCSAVGQPSPVISWDVAASGVSPIELVIGQTHDGYTVLKNGYLEVQSRSTLTRSTVKCIARNAAGHDQSESTTVLIQVNGMWSAWSAWSDCSVTCGSLQQMRTRSCSSPQPQNGGRFCTGNMTQTRECRSSVLCPIDGGWSTWTSWSHCSKSCGLKGNQSRVRECVFPKPAHGGKECLGNSSESKNCFPPECPSVWGEWGEWTACSETCGDNGRRYRERSCINSASRMEVTNCSNGSALDNEWCSSRQCPSFREFIARPEDQTVVVGNMAKFDCRYKPEELISKWYKGTELVKYAVKPERVVIANGSLMILEVERSDSGRYTCQVSEKDATAILTVTTSLSSTDDGKSGGGGVTLPAVGLIIAIGMVALILIALIFIVFMWRKRSSFNFFKTDHPPIEIQGAQLMQTQPRGSTSTEITIVASSTVNENHYVSDPVPKENSSHEEVADGERAVTSSSPSPNRSSSVPVLDNREEHLSHERKKRPRTLSIDGVRHPMKLQGLSSAAPRSAPATPLDHRSEVENTHKNAGFTRRLPGNPRTSSKPRTPISQATVPRRYSANIVDYDSDVVILPSSTLPRTKPRPNSDCAPVGPQWTASNSRFAQSLSDHSNDHTPVAESIPMKDMTRQRASVPYELSTANGIYTGQTSYPERSRPSGSSTAGYQFQPIANREPPKRSQSYDPYFLSDHRSSPAPRPLVDVDPTLEQVQSPRSQESDDVFDTEQLPVDMGQRSKPSAPLRYFSVPANHDNYESSAHDRRRSETNL